MQPLPTYSLVPLKDVKYEGDLEMVASPPHRERERWRIVLGVNIL